MLINGWAWAQTSTPAQPPVAQAHAASASSAAKPTNKQHSPAKKGKTKPAEQPEVVQAPPPPPTPEQMPPAQPRVSYQNGQLSIESQNSTLGQVLRSVQAKTGGSFEIPGAANNERVVAQLGPGRPRDVLASLLNGSKFDYIILGVSDEPGAVQKLILTVRKNPASTPANAAQNVPPVQPQDEVQPEDENIPEPVENTPAEVQNVPNQEPGQPPGYFNPSQPPDQGAQQIEGAPGGAQGAKTPEQLLQELQRMQQQQQQYQQQLNPANQTQPGVAPNQQPQ